jgi:hypothetical protein
MPSTSNCRDIIDNTRHYYLNEPFRMNTIYFKKGQLCPGKQMGLALTN